MTEFVTYGSINLDTTKEVIDIIEPLVKKTRFSLNHHNDIILKAGNNSDDIVKEFSALIHNIYYKVEMKGFDMDEFNMFGKIIIDYYEFNEADDVLVLATDCSPAITISLNKLIVYH